jgi:hypothetical protein
MTTARIGIVLSFAYGELDKSITPASFQSVFAAAEDCGSLINTAIKPVLFGWAIATAGGTIDMAAEAMNLRRDKPCFMRVLLENL